MKPAAMLLQPGRADARAGTRGSIEKARTELPRDHSHDRIRRMASADRWHEFPDPPARVCNGHARAPILLLCDHATNAIPKAFENLGLQPDQLNTHVAFDPGAAPLTAAMAEALDAAYVLCGYSRLLIDVNRALSDPDSIVTENDGIRVPGNEGLTTEDRSGRVAHIYEPYHEAVASTLAWRLKERGAQVVVSVHSFASRMRGIERPWDVGVVFNRDRRLARALVGELVGVGKRAKLTIGLNEPYSPNDRVYHTLERHAETRGLPCVMVEIRNDELTTCESRQRWADRLAAALRRIVPSFVPDGRPLSPPGSR